jgi:hypothetical protein
MTGRNITIYIYAFVLTCEALYVSDHNGQSPTGRWALQPFPDVNHILKHLKTTALPEDKKPA